MAKEEVAAKTESNNDSAADTSAPAE